MGLMVQIPAIFQPLKPLGSVAITVHYTRLLNNRANDPSNILFMYNTPKKYLMPEKHNTNKKHGI